MMKPNPAFANHEIEAAFEAFCEPERALLLQIRALIYHHAHEDSEIGTIIESLKWGQPSYDTRPRTGTPLRLGGIKSAPDHVALFAHCQSSVMEEARLHYQDCFQFEGNRALLISPHQTLPVDALGHVIRIALRYRLKT